MNKSEGHCLSDSLKQALPMHAFITLSFNVSLMSVCISILTHLGTPK